MYRPDRQRMHFHNYAAYAYREDGACYPLTAYAPSTKQAFAMMYRQCKGETVKIRYFKCEADMTRDEQEQWGFKPETVIPTHIDYSKLDLY